MNTPHAEVVVSEFAQKMKHELAHLKEHWWWFLVLGGFLLLCGIVAIAYPIAATASVVLVLGTVLLIAGLAMVVSSFWTGNWRAFLVQLLTGIVYVVVGLLAMESPGEAAGALTLMVAAMFMIIGVFRMVAAITVRFPQWGWVMLNGAVSLVLGIMVFRQFPLSAAVADRSVVWGRFDLERLDLDHARPGDS